MHPIHTSHNLVRRGRSGFTLVEILIVVTILAILAAMVLPQFVSATTETRENSIRMNVFRIRSQLGLYHQHHGGYPSLDGFADQMTLATDIDGNTAPPGSNGFPYGPYLQEIPPNANTSSSDVGDGAVGSSAWFYNEATGEFHANDSDEMFAF